MIEQARNAVADYLARLERDTLACDLTGDEQRGLARAVLEALREPSEAMRLVGGYTQLHGETEDDRYAYGIYQAMIDAALAEQP